MEKRGLNALNLILLCKFWPNLSHLWIECDILSYMNFLFFFIEILCFFFSLVIIYSPNNETVPKKERRKENLKFSLEEKYKIKLLVEPLI